MLTCKDVTERSSGYLDGELPWRGRLRIRLHLLMCRHCRLFVRQFEAGLRMFGKLRPPEVSEDQIQQILGRTREDQDQERE